MHACSGAPTGESPPADPRMAGFFRRLIADHGASTLLDCACGTGRFLRLFHSLGLTVEGSDISPAMLAQARKHLAREQLEIALHQLDYRLLPEHLVQRFDAVACLSSSLLHMPDEVELERAFRSMHAVLAAEIFQWPWCFQSTGTRPRPKPAPATWSGLRLARRAP